MKKIKLLIIFLFTFALINSGVAEDLHLRIDEVTGLVGNTAQILIINDSSFSNVAMLDLTVKFDKSKLTYQNSNSDYLGSDNINSSNNSINIVWIYSMNTMEIPQGDTLITINLKVEGGSKTGDFIPI